MKHRNRMLKYGPGVFFEADKGKGGGKPAGDGNEPGEGEQEEAPDADDTKEKPADQKKFSQADLDAIVQDRLAREKKKKDDATAKARKEAEEAALLKNQEFQKLAEERAKTIADLEPLKEQLDGANETIERYKGALDNYLEAEKKDLPKHVLALLEKLDPVEQMDYIAENRESLGKGPEGIPPSPNPKERKLSDEESERARKEQGSLYSRY
jgi:hypothetical protein